MSRSRFASGWDTVTGGPVASALRLARRRLQGLGDASPRPFVLLLALGLGLLAVAWAQEKPDRSPSKESRPAGSPAGENPAGCGPLLFREPGLEVLPRPAPQAEAAPLLQPQVGGERPEPPAIGAILPSADGARDLRWRPFHLSRAPPAGAR